MDWRWQGFGDPELRSGRSSFVSSLKEVVRTQALPLLKTQRLASMLVRASIIPFLFRQELFEE